MSFHRHASPADPYFGHQWAAQERIGARACRARVPPAEAARGFWGGVLGFVLAFLLVHLLMRKAAPRADPPVTVSEIQAMRPSE